MVTECPTHRTEHARVKALKCAHVDREWVVLLHSSPGIGPIDAFAVLTRHGCLVVFGSRQQAESQYQQCEQLMRETGRPCCP